MINSIGNLYLLGIWDNCLNNERYLKQKQVQKMTEDFAKRILVVLDRNYLNNRSEEEYNNIHNIVNTVFGEEYKVEFDVF